MANRIKDIHLFQSLEELRTKSAVGSVEKTSAKLLLKSSDKLYELAEKSLLDGDEELAYVYFFRFCDAVTASKKKDDFLKDPSLSRLISSPKVLRAITSLEKLGDSLAKRYALKKEIENAESVAKSREYNDALEYEKNQKKRTSKDGKSLEDGTKSLSALNGVVQTNGVEKKTVQNNGMSPKELKNLLEQKAKRILLVDCRDKSDFMSNHIDYSNCICIPAQILSEGMSANAILTKLRANAPESYVHWDTREKFDFIVLYDWNSNIDNRLPVLSIVYDALTKWDPNCKSKNVYVIQGGMKNIYYTYPSLLTNPQTAVNTTGKTNGSATDLTDHKRLDSISYPSLDLEPKNAKSESVINSNHHHPPNDGGNVPKTSSSMPIDRSTKPTYNSNANHKVSNGVDAELGAPLGATNSEISTIEKTDIKVKEYSQALDAVIESSKIAVKNEQEVNELREKANASSNKELTSQLKAKEEESEMLKQQLEKRTDQVNMLKAQYEAVLREQKSKQYLPRIRVPAAENEITSKELEQQKLNEQVKQMRKERLEQEARRKEELMRKPEVRDETSSKLPPLSSSNAGTNLKPHSAPGVTQLPSISSTTAPAHPGSAKPVSSLSRPISQDTSGIITKQRIKDEGFEPPRNASLKRSHSHPNIAQSHDEDTGDDTPTSSSQVPRIDRGLKPAGPRAPETASTPRRYARNFEVVGSTEHSKTGLKNLGNSCYMNSIIQCLSHTPKLVDFLRKGEYLKEWHPSRSPTNGDATEELAAAIKQMHSGHRAISLLDLKCTVGRFHTAFRGTEQQDSHEFITILLDWLHEEMNRAPEKVKPREQQNDGLSDEVAAARAWEDYKRSNDSKISDLFSGLQKSCLTCSSCNGQSVTFEPFRILSVPIPSLAKKSDIQKCIELYTTVEPIQWNCVHCKREGQATKKIDLWRLPPYLIIHIQRFYNDGYWKKRLAEIDFPVDNLSLNRMVLGTNGNNCNDYQLYAVSNHYGSMDHGHYTAYCRPNGSGGWWKFDDQEVYPINSRDVPSSTAYILFYQNRMLLK